MAATGFTPIQLYHSTTPSAAPTAANLLPGELAINIADGIIYYEDSGGVVKQFSSGGGAQGFVLQIQAGDNGVPSLQSAPANFGII